MQYEEALRNWGVKKILEKERLYNLGEVRVFPSTVKVEFNFNEGYGCCGGRDPDCYCSFAESPSAEVLIVGNGTRKAFGAVEATALNFQVRMDFSDFDFATVLKEIVEAAGGNVSD